MVITVTTDNPLGAPCEAAIATYSLTVNALPSAPLIGSITQPTCGVATGSVLLTGLPPTGVWTLTRTPGNVTTTGTGTSRTITGLAQGTYTFTVTNANGCTSGPSGNVVINAQPPTPTAPVIGSIISPTCTVSTGGVILSGLPSTGTWIITRSPGGITTSGTGVTTTIQLIPSGSYTFTVTNSYGCNSPSSAVVVIPAQPPTPTAPVVGAITAPTCTVPTGSVVLSGLPATGTWTITRYPGGITTTGTGTSTTIAGLPTGTFNFTVTNEFGCVSPLSANVVIPEQPDSPPAPVVGTITQPTCNLATGSVVLNGLPATGTWTLTRNPGGVTTTGTGTSTTITGLPSGTYTFTVTNADGCVSLPSAQVVINPQPPTPSAPIVGAITQPSCTLATGSVLLSGLPSTGTWTITTSPGGTTTTGTGTSGTVSGLLPGIYTFTVTNSYGCISVASAPVVINEQPPLPDAPVHSIDCSLGFGNAIITVISPTGSGYSYSLDGGTFQTNTSFSGVDNGSHTITVRNSYGCTTTGPSFDVSCGCANPPTLALGSSSGSTCGTTPITVTGNTFGGSATAVTITENGSGTVTPSSSSTSPFSFTYTPVAADVGRVITITVTTNNPLGAPCAPVSLNYALTVNLVPDPPTIGTITQPTCEVATGSVLLYGLPSSGTWELLIMPTFDVITGTGSTTTITGLGRGTYNFTVTNAVGCVSSQSADLIINEQPPTPDEPWVESITQPTCATSTGSVVLIGLPTSGTWIVRRTPGSVSTTGTGPTVTIAGIPENGVYTFTVTNSFGCTSSPSEDVNIFPQPETPAAPSVGTIVPPTCSVPTGSVTLFGLPAAEGWILTQYPGTITYYGTGTSIALDNLEPGTYNFTVTNEAGCISQPSENVTIPMQPPTPSAPVIGTVTQPTYAVPTGSVELRELPATGTWTIIRDPGNVTTTGTGMVTVITGLEPGVFTFRVTNSFGCTSLRSDEVTISTPGIPTLVITNPGPVCYPSTVDITADLITEGSTPGLTYTYWQDYECTIEYETPNIATRGTYYIRGTTVSGYFDIKPVVVTVVPPPVPNAGTDQVLNYIFDAQLNASLGTGEKGNWQVIKGSGVIENDTVPVTTIRGLSLNENIIRWMVTNEVCPPAADTLTITVNDLIIPTLITPNLDGKNDYFVLRGIITLGRTELLIFDRRGILVYKNSNYDNKWDGVDQKGNPLPADTYFYSIRPANGQPYNGYIVIER
ncbi:MAG: gliding motility-associated C-terminal domain-containing protein [Bacteroidales bacterium]|nr:gliding motility-associated C-terminal domain-containing protein [Bacteroidales bacterium]